MAKGRLPDAVNPADPTPLVDKATSRAARFRSELRTRRHYDWR